MYGKATLNNIDRWKTGYALLQEHEYIITAARHQQQKPNRKKNCLKELYT